MQTTLKQADHFSSASDCILLAGTTKPFTGEIFTKEEKSYIEREVKDKKEIISIHRFSHWIFVVVPEKETDTDRFAEKLRKMGDILAVLANEKKISSIQLYDLEDKTTSVLHLSEGMLLGNYSFLKYKTGKEVKAPSLKEIVVFSKQDFGNAIVSLNHLATAVSFTRNLVNEPNNVLDAVTFSKEVAKAATKAGIKTEVLNKKKIESLKMGGLLAVNKGSVIPPTFTIMEWKPARCINKKPVVLVGKGVVYDTGGLNLKPGDSMYNMKCDMAGAATVAGVVLAIAHNKLPVHVIGLLPATDNRPGGNAYAAGDVITMHSGKKVEVINTDAEGRMILADALSYASRYKPALVINLATLTGSASRAIGKYGIVAMQAKAADEFLQLRKAGEQVNERLVEFPFWEEYDEIIKSEIADIKNLGNTDAGAITAGKFLEHFTDYPFIHLDIAGPAFTEKKFSYFGQGGTAIGLRLLYRFFEGMISQKKAK